jgi:AraC-like DNA-binding protein
MNFHIHPGFEYTYVFGGEGAYEAYYQFGNQIKWREKEKVTSGHTVFFTDSITHKSIGGKTPLSQMVIVFDPAKMILPMVQKYFKKIVQSSEAGKYCFHSSSTWLLEEEILKTILYEMRRQKEGYCENVKLLFNELIMVLSRNLTAEAPSVEMRNIKDARITKIISYVDSHYFEPLNSILAAKYVGISPRNLQKIFKKNLKVSFKEYLLRRRIEEAKNLLQTPNLQITRICFECGFDSLQSFNRVYKKYQKTSPSEFRKLILKNHELISE